MYKIGHGIKYGLIGILICITAIKAPDLHYNYIRNKVQKTTVKVTNKKGTSGGSGSHVKAPSGQVYILTNAHVCELGENGTIYITDDYERVIPRKIIEVSDFTDLCLIESLPNYHGYLSIGSEPEPGEIVAAVGHPSLMPTTMSRGEIIGQQMIDVMDHVMNPDDESDKCDLPKNQAKTFDTLFGPVKVCLIHINANQTTVVILPGNSGSPLVNFYGNLSGVFFAGGGANWGDAITLADVQKFLKSY